MNKNIVPQKITYKHLTLEEREFIFMCRVEGMSFTDIGELISRHPTTVSRECKRNISLKNKYRYLPSEAQADYKKRKSKAHKRIRLKNRKIQNYVRKKLRKGWTPELIAGRLPLENPGLSTNYESIYQFIYDKRPHWIKYLPRAHKKRRKRDRGLYKGSRIPNRVNISERPEEANNRTEVGHWEADTIVSRQSKAVLLVLYERSIRLVKISKLERKTARQMSNHINYIFTNFPKEFKKSITYDNGSENSEHQRVNEKNGCSSYFCNPYHSWEKGGVEQVNGLIRRYYPKKTDFSKLNRYEIREVERLLNTRPRKCLGFKTPLEVFQNTALTL